MRNPESSPGSGAVAIGNPQTAEFEVCRTTLLPSALKTLAANKREPLPMRLFELSDVVLLDSSRDVGAHNERRLVAVHCGKASEFEVIHGLLNRIMEVLNVPQEGGCLVQATVYVKSVFGCCITGSWGTTGVVLRQSLCTTTMVEHC